jgi:hypothetical protein
VLTAAACGVLEMATAAERIVVATLVEIVLVDTMEGAGEKERRRGGEKERTERTERKERRREGRQECD